MSPQPAGVSDKMKTLIQLPSSGGSCNFLLLEEQSKFWQKVPLNNPQFQMFLMSFGVLTFRFFERRKMTRTFVIKGQVHLYHKRMILNFFSLCFHVRVEFFVQPDNCGCAHFKICRLGTKHLWKLFTNPCLNGDKSDFHAYKKAQTKTNNGRCLKVLTDRRPSTYMGRCW